MIDNGSGSSVRNRQGEEIVVHGEDPASLVEQAREQGVDAPYVFYVDSPRPGIVKIGL